MPICQLARYSHWLSVPKKFAIAWAKSRNACCYTELGLPHRAQPLLEPVLSGYDQRYTRELALHTSWLAESHVQAGNLDRAEGLAARVAQLDAQTTSAYSTQRVHHLTTLLHSAASP